MPNKKTTVAQRRAVAKYQKEKVETIAVRVPKGQKEYYKNASIRSGSPSLNQFVVDSMDEKIERMEKNTQKGNTKKRK